VRRILLVIALIVLAAPASARADEYTAQAGTVIAKLTWTPPPKDDGAPVFALQVQRAGTLRFDRALRVKNCAGPYCRPAASHASDAPLAVADLDRDGEPEVIVFAYWGGAHCCYLAYVLQYDAAAAAYRVRFHQFADAGARLIDLGHDGRVELLSADHRLAYEFASFGGSGMPLQVWRFRAGRFADVTRAFPQRIRKDAGRWWRAYRRALRQHGEQFGVLAAWAADEYRLGRRHAVLRRLHRERLRGHLRAAGALGSLWPSGRRYVRRLDKRLRGLGYLRRRPTAA
jgi:hypothetical protein